MENKSDEEKLDYLVCLNECDAYNNESLWNTYNNKICRDNLRWNGCAGNEHFYFVNLEVNEFGDNVDWFYNGYDYKDFLNILRN